MRDLTTKMGLGLARGSLRAKLVSDVTSEIPEIGVGVTSRAR
jgi:hypothetical protein